MGRLSFGPYRGSDPMDRALSLEQVARELACSVQTIRRRIADGELYAFRLGAARNSAYRVPRSELDRITTARPLSRRPVGDAQSVASKS